MLELFRHLFGESPVSVKQLTGAGSNRDYYRLTSSDGKSVIGVRGVNPKENHAFLTIGRQMSEKGIAVPNIISVSTDETCYLQEDLGDISLYSLIEKSKKEGRGWDENLVNILHNVMQDLPHIQFETANGFDFSNCVREEVFSSMTIRWDLNYFKYCFLKLTGIEFDEMRLEKVFMELEDSLLSISESITVPTFLYRDFQSRNVMIYENKPYYIDFQGGYNGPIYYDVASFLWQTRAAYPESLRKSLIDTYLESLTHYYNINKNQFIESLNLFVYFRLLQVLGTYGYRGLHEHKTIFVEPIIQTLQQIINLNKFAYITEILSKVAELPQFKQQNMKDSLIVRITSFSYKKGIPEDYSGNGGGFVFDCRATYNPGKYPEYKQLTGLDQPVIDFLESEESMLNFISHVFSIVDPAVETYIKRGFSSLMVNFGCTGGQHRSVYCAQHLAEHLATKFTKAKILLCHREQNIEKHYNF